MSLNYDLSNIVRNTVGLKGEEHFARPAGSTLAGVNSSDGREVIEKILLALPWEEVTEEVARMGASFGKCRYFRAELPEGVIGQERIALLSELTPDDLARVRVVKGHHGKLEFQLPESATRAAKVVHMIVGDAISPTNEVALSSAIIYTWYPGRITPPVALESATVKFV